MKLKRLLSLAGILTAILVFSGSSLYALDAVAVQSAQGFPGGTDTVDVYITTDSAYISAEVGLSFDKTKLSYVDGSLVVNPAAWNSSWGAPQVSVDAATGKVSVALFSLDANAALPKASSPMKLLSVVLKVAGTATPGTVTVTPNGRFISRTDIINSTDGTNVTNLAAGTFTILSSYSLSADSVTSSIGGTVAVPVYMTNIQNVVGAEFTIGFNSTQLMYADSVVINKAIWKDGEPQPATVDASVAGQVKVAIFTLSGGYISSNNESVILATIYLKAKATAVEAASNPLTVIAATVTSRDELYNTTTNSPTRYNGNVNIKGKFSLRVGSDAAAPRGGSDTVKVYLKNSETIVSAQATLKFDASKYTATSANVVVNKDIFSNVGSVQTEVAVSDSTVSVASFAFSADSITAGDGDKLMFTVILNVKNTAAVGYDSLQVSGSVGIRNEDYTTDNVNIGTLYKGAFLIRSPFELQVENVYGRPNTTQKMNVLLTNRDVVVGNEVTVTFDNTKLTYVTNSVQVNSAIWNGGAPTPEIVAGANSIKIGLTDLTGTKSIAAGGSGQLLLSLEFTAKAALTTGMSSTVGITGIMAVRDEMYNVTDVAAAGVSGSFNVVDDITPPSPVRNVSMIKVGTEYRLTWTNPTDADLARITVVRRNVSDSSEETLFSGIATSYTDATLASGVAYVYVLTAYDNVGNASEAYVTQPTGPAVDPNLDFNQDGKVNAGDLYMYLSDPSPSNIAYLADLIAYLLAQPVPATMLAASNSGSVQVQPGAAYVSLSSSFETFVARFTFSYNKAYEFSGVALGQAMQGKAMIKPMAENGQLVVDVISLTGFTPSTLTSELFTVMFRNGSYDQASLKIEKVEVADRNGTIYNGEKGRLASSAVLPKAYALDQNSPNPFNPSTTIAYEIPESTSGTKVVLAVYNIRGQKVITLVDELKESGRYSVNWDGRSEAGQRVSSGVYFYRLQAGDFSAVRKMVILK
ncbi:T9SS type A sorting domain-containing protein [bacterium]|nr:T9SS type A sorting domain-containing protein [bacterium]